jgi:hypothetical protein
MAGIMLTASQARAKSKNDLAIFNEIREIETAILVASSDGELEVVVSGTAMTATGSGMSLAREYFKAWQGSVPNRAKEQQMAEVVSYFYNLGYQIERKVNPQTGDTFRWSVYW